MTLAWEIYNIVWENPYPAGQILCRSPEDVENWLFNNEIISCSIGFTEFDPEKMKWIRGPIIKEVKREP
jgi:hypothetical protein